MKKIEFHHHNGCTKYLLLFSMLYCTILLLSGVYVYRPVPFSDYQFSAACLIYPLSYSCNDIVCEMYGYHYSRRLIWFGMICVFTFAFLSKFINNIPYPTQWHDQASFITVLGSYLRLSFAGLASMLIGEFTNTIALSKWKKIAKGRHFWLRSVSSTSVGALMDTGIEYVIAFSGVVSDTKLIQMLLMAYLFRVIYAVMISAPSSFIVMILKNVENSDGVEPVSYNPFRLDN